MKISEIRVKETATLREELRALETSRFDTVVRSVTEAGEGYRLKGIRRDIARYKTEINARQRDGKA